MKLYEVRGIHTIWSSLIRRTCSSSPTTCLLRIADARARSANRAVRGELTSGRTTVLVAGITDRVGRELASGGITARIRPTPTRPSAVTVFSGFDNAISTLAARDGRNVLVGRQASRLDAVSPNRRADIADRARREFLDIGARRGVHDIRAARIASRGAQRTTLLRLDRGSIATRLRGAIMNGTKGVSRFMGDHLPFRAGPDHHIGATHRVVARRGRFGLSGSHAGLP